MSFPINIPKLGMSMKDATLADWKYKEGDRIVEGSIVLIIETEKITWEVESIATGFLHILVEAGAKALVGEVVGMLAETEEEFEALQKEYPTGAAVDVETAPSPIPTTVPEVEAVQEQKFKPSSPSARRLAKELGIDLALVPGTGPGGRIVEADIKLFHDEAPPAPKITPLAREIATKAGLDISKIMGTGEMGKITKEDIENALKAREMNEKPEPQKSIPMTGMRKTIAEHMHASLQNTAQFHIITEVDVTEMVRFRDIVREEYKADDSVRISYNDIFILAVSRTLKRFPIMNSTLARDKILLHDSVNMGIAVAVPNGLIVPVLHDADKKGLLQITKEVRELAKKAREGSLGIDDVSGGTFTISNTSMFEVDMSTPILNSPETGILGVGRIKEKPAVYNGEIVIRSMIYLSLTIDHQTVDGVPAAEFLQTLARYLQHPNLIMS